MLHYIIMKHPLTLGIIALFVAAALYLAFMQTDSGPAEPSAAAPGQGMVGTAAESQDPFDVEIVFTDQGYEPREVTIQKGQRVRFTNKAATLAMWPASAVHPTHSIYPEKDASNCLGSSFDACAELPPGDFFAFTFNRAGEWRYHDHITAYLTGTITVTE